MKRDLLRLWRLAPGGVALLAAIALVAACAQGSDGTRRAAVTADRAAASPSASVTIKSPPPTPTETLPESGAEADFTIAAAGDFLIHKAVWVSATKDGTIDFTRLTGALRPWISGADLAICHLEVPVVPDSQKPSGYPVFGAPRQIIASVAKDGWTGCSTSSNHSLDQGVKGIGYTLGQMDAQHLGHAGTARSRSEEAEPQLYRLERGGRTITVAHLASTYGTNGIPIPASAPWSVTLNDADTIIERAKKARAEGADLVVVTLHAGDEYVTKPNDEQRRIAKKLAASKAVDLMIGHHVHVAQPIEHYPGGPGGTGMWAAFGLGNLLSNQDEACCKPATAMGALLLAKVHVGDDVAAVSSVSWTGTTVDRAGGHQLLPLLPGKHKATGQLSAAQLDSRDQLLRTEIGDEAPRATEPPTPTGPRAVAVPKKAAAG